MPYDEAISTIRGVGGDLRVYALRLRPHGGAMERNLDFIMDAAGGRVFGLHRLLEWKAG